MNNRKKILWLVSWYPNKYDPFDGDFIQRHARAAALHDDIHVFFLRFSAEQKKVERAWRSNEGLSEEIFYLPKERGIIGNIKNYLLWRKIGRAELALLVNRHRPHLVHVHVPWKVGLFAFWIKRKFAIPYFITEHWGIYNQTVDDNITARPLYFRLMLNNIFRRAAGFASVSRFLGEGVNRLLLPKAYTVIPNAVDTKLFFPVPEKATRFTFLHVSNMVPLKNIGGLLKAFQLFVAQSAGRAQLVLIGNRDEEFVLLAQQMGLFNQSVFFRGELPYGEVAAEMQKAHVLVLNSDMENSPCVIGEALCCGLPVIATRVGGIPELLSAENSILVPPQDDKALAKAFEEMKEQYSSFSPQKIAEAAEKRFSMPAVGQQFHDLYSRAAF
jgi:glycosyltransferase involved in cell wall biosynthesis